MQDLLFITQIKTVTLHQKIFKLLNTYLFKPSLLAGVSCFLMSCSSSQDSKNKSIDPQNYEYMSEQDYADHLSLLKSSFLKQPEINIIAQSPQMRRYFEKTSREVLERNEIFFRKLENAKITLLNLEIPLHFSLPGGEIFLSKGLMTKYVKHESVLVSILSFELIKSEKNLYPKESYIPTGVFSLERIVQMNRLPLEDKMEIHKWAYYMTTRTGYDGEYYLSWLQILNRNTADFVFLVGDINLIPREESLFKAFLIQNANEETVISKKGSSREFYRVINKLREMK